MKDEANGVVARLQNDLLQARKARDKLTVETLQAALARITNAEAVAHSSTNAGMSEVPRKHLSQHDIRAILQDEIAELTEAQKSMASNADHPYAVDLANKIKIVSSYL